MHDRSDLEEGTKTTTIMVIIIIMKTIHRLEEGEVEDAAEAVLDLRPTSHTMNNTTTMESVEDIDLGTTIVSLVNIMREVKRRRSIIKLRTI